MNKSLYKIVVALVLLSTLLAGCKAKKNVIKKRKVKSDSAEVIEKVKDVGIAYESIEIKGSAKTQLDGKKYNFTIIFRNNRDKEIWISVRAMLGIEVARLKCTPEHVKIFSRIAGIKESGDWSKMADFLGYPIDYYTLQGMMTRSLFVPERGDLTELDSYIHRISESGVLLVPDYNSDSFLKSDKIANFWPQFLIDNKSYAIVKTRVVPTRNEWQLEAEYGNESNQNFAGLPNSFKFEVVDEGQDLQLSFTIQNVIVNQELKMPYQW